MSCYPQTGTEGSAGEVVDHSLLSCGACQAVADEETKTCSQASNGQLTKDEETSFRKYPVGDMCDVDKDVLCPSIRHKRKRGRRNVPRRRPNLLVILQRS